MKKDLKELKTKEVNLVSDLIHPFFKDKFADIKELADMSNLIKEAIYKAGDDYLATKTLGDILNFEQIKEQYWVGKDHKLRHLKGKEIYEYLLMLKDLPYSKVLTHTGSYSQAVTEYASKKIYDTKLEKVDLLTDEKTKSVYFKIKD